MALVDQRHGALLCLCQVWCLVLCASKEQLSTKMVEVLVSWLPTVRPRKRSFKQPFELQICPGHLRLLRHMAQGQPLAIQSKWEHYSGCWCGQSIQDQL